jgi:hypothetical protein
MQNLIRVALVLGLAACTLLRLYVAVQALALGLGLVWAVLAVVALLLSGWLWALRLAVLAGALLLWHWSLLPALLLAAPRLFLMLPGLISTFLASRRHPRPRWSPYLGHKPA